MKRTSLQKGYVNLDQKGFIGMARYFLSFLSLASISQDNPPYFSDLHSPHLKKRSDANPDALATHFLRRFVPRFSRRASLTASIKKIAILSSRFRAVLNDSKSNISCIDKKKIFRRYFLRNL
jgi:hypothetical protein